MSVMELIETLWNVNQATWSGSIAEIGELIETLWNVNLSVIAACDNAVSRINRNIVECKSFNLGHSRARNRELIETLWNVNLFLLFYQGMNIAN